MHIAPEMLEAAYSYLLTTPPFRRWKLPPADEVEFRVVRHPDRRGWHKVDNGRHIICLSDRCIGRTDSLMATMAHEIIHMHGDRKGIRSAHGAWFKRQAAMACRQHGFDPLLF